MDRMSTPAGRLARRGFGDPHHAVTVIEPWIERCEDEGLIRRLVDEILASADPDLAMSGFARLDAHPAINDDAHDLLRSLGH